MDNRTHNLITNHEREELVEEIAQLLDKALGRGKPVVKDGNLQPIYELIAHYQRWITSSK